MSKRQIRSPKAIVDILSYYYKISSYNSDKIRIPSKIYASFKQNKLACIIAFILDEGAIRDIISVAIKSKEFLMDFKKLIEDIGYKCRDIKFHKGNAAFCLSFSNKTIKQFYKDYLQLVEEFPKTRAG